MSWIAELEQAAAAHGVAHLVGEGADAGAAQLALRRGFTIVAYGSFLDSRTLPNEEEDTDDEGGKRRRKSRDARMAEPDSIAR